MPPKPPYRSLTIPMFVLIVLIGTSVSAQNWGDEPKDTPAGISVADTPTLAPTVSVELKAAAKDLAARPGLTIKQRRAMGITFKSLRKEVRAMHDAGELEGKTRAQISVEVMDRLVRANPKAFADPAIDWDSALAWIEKLISILMFLLMFI